MAGKTVGFEFSAIRVVAKRLLVWSLEVVCGIIDRMPMFLRYWWNCKFAQWSIALDERWGTNVWKVN